MKKVIICSMLLILSTYCFSQTDSITKPVTRQDYLRESKTERIVSNSFLGVGTFLIIGAFAWGPPIISIGSIFGPSEEPTQSQKTWNTLGVVGLIMYVPATVLLISARHHKKMAASLSLDNQKLYLPERKGSVLKMQTALALKIPL